MDAFGDKVANHFMWVLIVKINNVSKFSYFFCVLLVINYWFILQFGLYRSSLIASLGSAVASTPIDVVRVSTKRKTFIRHHAHMTGYFRLNFGYGSYLKGYTRL